MHPVAFPSVTVLGDHCILGKAAPGSHSPSAAPLAGQCSSRFLAVAVAPGASPQLPPPVSLLDFNCRS